MIFTGLDNDSRLAREEIFGPVTCVIKFSDYEEALAQANDSEYGLAATIWTRDLKTALDASRRLEAGFVQINQNIVVQPEPVLWRREAVGPGPRSVARSHAGPFHAQEDRDLQPGLKRHPTN